MNRQEIVYLAVIVLVPVITLLISLLLMRCLITLLPRLGLIDVPKDGRRIHNHPVPRGGGIGIILSFCIVVFTFSALFGTHIRPGIPMQELKMLLPLLILVPLGILDDRFTLSARWKFLFQIIAAVVAWYCGVRMNTFLCFNLSVWLSLLFTVIWITAMINAFNMIDGIDGLAGGIAVISSCSLAFILICIKAEWAALMLLCFAGACLGFLKYNWFPARLFMGDTGSMFIGYILGAVGLGTSTKIATIPSILIPILACGVPVTDIFLAIWRRLTRPNDDNSGKSILSRSTTLIANLGKGDKSHLHHRLLKYFNDKQPKTVGTIYLLSLMLALAGILCFFLPEKLYWLGFMIALAAMTMMLHRLAVIEIWNSTKLLYRDFQKPGFGILLNVINPIYDTVALSISLMLVSGLHLFQFAIMAQWVGPVMFVLILSQSYRVFWNFPSSEEYFRLLLRLAIGFVACFFFDKLLNGATLNAMDCVFAFALSAVFILGERLFLLYLRILLVTQHNKSALLDKPPLHILLCGVNSQGWLYLDSLLKDKNRVAQENIIGFIDENPYYKHGFCYGLKVLGDIGDIPDIFSQSHFSKIVLCRKITPENMRSLQQFCNLNNVTLTKFLCKEENLDGSPTLQPNTENLTDRQSIHNNTDTTLTHTSQPHTLPPEHKFALHQQ